jgi:cytidyltransferase-like protein
MYDSIPKNHLLLSYVHEYGDDGKIKKTVQDKGELDDWADLLGIDRAPIIFQGYLTEEQKSKITEFLRTPFDQLVERFKTQSFVRFIIGTLNPDLKKTALNEDLDKDVEGIVFRFGDPNKESEPVLAKMVDPVFTQMAKDKSMKQRENKPSDFLGLTLMDVMNFILERGIDTFRVEGDNEDERYVSFMGDVFSRFLEEYSDKYKGADFEEPEYLKREEFRLNKDLIDDRRVLKYVNEDDSFESLFKLMLNSFRKIKSRAGGIITKGMMEQMNLLIRDIKDYIQNPRKGRLHEGFMSFLDFKKEMAPEVEYLKEEDEETEADENPFYSYKEFISALETIDSSPKPKSIVITEKEGEDGKKLKDVNLLVGRFQPFHNGHLKMAKFLKEKNNLPSVAVVVYPGHNKSGKSPFNEDTIKKYMDGVVRDEKEVIDYIIVQRGLIGSAIVKLLEKGYKPQLIGAGEDRVNDYTKQLEYIKKSDIGDQMQDLKLVQTPRTTSATKVREEIKNEDYAGFKRLVPKAVENVYDLLKAEMKAGEGKIKESYVFEDDNEEFETIYNMYEAKIQDAISLGEIGQEVDFLKKYIDSLAGQENLTADQIKRISSISAVINRIRNLARDSKTGEEELNVIIADLLFGSMGDKKSLGRKRELSESLLNELTDSTITNLIDRYVNKKKDNYLTISDINAKNGIYDINGLESLNGISGRDLRKIYNFDAGLATGNSKRGKGESLFSIAFDAGTNVFAGGDVVSREDNRVVEIKSTVNAAITPKSGDPISPAVYQILKRSEQIYEIPKISKKNPNITLQKNDSVELINKIKDGGDEAKDFLDLVSSISKIDSLTADDVLPVILLLQANYYSKDMDEFQTLAVFVENKEFPDKLAIIESTPGIGFVTKNNIDILKKAGIAPKITFSSLTSANKVEIYRFDRK